MKKYIILFFILVLNACLIQKIKIKKIFAGEIQKVCNERVYFQLKERVINRYTFQNRNHSVIGIWAFLAKRPMERYLSEIKKRKSDFSLKRILAQSKEKNKLIIFHDNSNYFEKNRNEALNLAGKWKVIKNKIELNFQYENPQKLKTYLKNNMHPEMYQNLKIKKNYKRIHHYEFFKEYPNYLFIYEEGGRFSNKYFMNIYQKIK